MVHRDLKLENVLFRAPDDDTIKIIDFGISGMATTSNTEKSTAGSPAYIAPECLQGEVFMSHAQDTWAIGLMFYAMLYGTLPFYSEESEEDLFRQICTKEVRFDPRVPVTKQGREVIKMFLNKDPDKRIELNDFAEMDYNLWDEQEFMEEYKAAV